MLYTHAGVVLIILFRRGISHTRSQDMKVGAIRMFETPPAVVALPYSIGSFMRRVVAPFYARAAAAAVHPPFGRPPRRYGSLVSSARNTSRPYALIRERAELTTTGGYALFVLMF